eukprot:COSAG05_NODE_5529_length_1150_cov_3.374881_1_plen_303_part_00
MIHVHKMASTIEGMVIAAIYRWLRDFRIFSEFYTSCTERIFSLNDFHTNLNANCYALNHLTEQPFLVKVPRRCTLLEAMRRPKPAGLPQLDWARMRPYELKKHCRHRGLCEVGQKATLVARLEGAPEAQPGHAAPVPENDPGTQARNAALKEASKIGDVGQIQALLADGAPVNAVDGQGYTPLYCATMYGQEQAVAALLAAGAEVDRENNNGVSPLMAAARDGVTAIVGALLAAGADVSQVDEFGRTAHSIAVGGLTFIWVHFWLETDICVTLAWELSHARAMDTCPHANAPTSGNTPKMCP